MRAEPLRGRWRAAARPARVWAAALLAAAVVAVPARAAQQENAFGVPSAPDAGPVQQPSAPAPPPSYQPPPPPPRLQAPPQAPSQPPAPQAQAPQPPLSPAQYLVGTWHGHTAEDGGQFDIYVSFRPDNTFVQQQSGIDGQGRVQIMGRFDVTLGPNGGTIVFQPQRWEPRQVCANGNCQPFNPPPSMSIPFQPLGRDSLRTQYGSFQRIGPPR